MHLAKRLTGGREAMFSNCKWRPYFQTANGGHIFKLQMKDLFSNCKWRPYFQTAQLRPHFQTANGGLISNCKWRPNFKLQMEALFQTANCSVHNLNFIWILVAFSGQRICSWWSFKEKEAGGGRRWTKGVKEYRRQFFRLHTEDIQYFCKTAYRGHNFKLHLEAII